MRIPTSARVCTALAAVVLVAAPLTARAERHPEHMITLGYQTEHADVVAVAVPGPTEIDAESGNTMAAFAIETVIRGDVAPGARVVVTHRDLGHGPVWDEGATQLVFLRRVTAGDGAQERFTSLSGAYGFRTIRDGTPSARFPGLVTSIAATLGPHPESNVSDRAGLARVLVSMATDADDGIAASGALDLARHAAVHELVSDAERAALVASMRARKPGRVRRQVALAVARLRAPGAAHALVDLVLEPNSDRDRTGIAEALRILDDETSEPRTIMRLAKADPAQQRHLLALLRAIGGTSSVDPVRALTAAPESAVRADAAHTLGEVSRNIHRADQEADVAGREDLTALLARAETHNERRAALWALAQLDDPRAFDDLRRIAADEATPDVVRSYALRLLERPRTSLILE